MSQRKITGVQIDQATLDVGSMSGTLPIGHGGTGQTSANDALNALLPSQATNAGKELRTDGTNATWQTATVAWGELTGDINNQTDLKGVVSSFAHATTTTGVTTTTDTVSLVALTTTTLRVTAVQQALFYNDISGSITSCMVSFPQTDYPLSGFTFPAPDGIYLRYIAYDHLQNVILSTTDFKNDLPHLQLGYIVVHRVSGVVSFLDGTAGPRNVFTQPDWAGNGGLVDDYCVPKCNIVVTPNAALTIRNGAGTIVGESVNWGSANVNVRAVTAVNPTSFITTNPSTAMAATLPSPGTAVQVTQYWNGSAMTNLTGSHATVQRFIITVRGAIFLNVGETFYNNLDDATNAMPTASFTNFLPDDGFIELCRFSSKRLANDLSSNSDAVFYYPGGGGTIGGSGAGTVTSVDVSGGSTGLTFSGGPITSNGTITMAGTLGIGSGGTGQTTQTAAFNALSPQTTKGDIIVRDSTNDIRFAVGADGSILVADSSTTPGVRWGYPNGTWCGTAGGTANALTLTPVPPITSYASAIGQRFYFKASANTSATNPTMNISGLGIIIMSMGNTTIPIGGLISGNVYILIVESATILRVAAYDAVSVNGDTMNGKLYILPTDSLELGTGSLYDGQITFRNSASNSYVRIQTGGTGSNWSLSLPTSAGGANTFLHNNGSGVTVWNAVDLATADVTGILTYNKGGTAQSSWTRGDILYASATNTLSKLNVGASGTVLSSDGTDVSWGTVSSALGYTPVNKAGDTMTGNLNITETVNGDVGLIITNNSNGTIADSIILLTNDSAHSLAMVMFGSGYSGSPDSALIFTDNANPLFLGTNSAARIAIDSNGNVAIGTNVLSRTDLVNNAGAAVTPKLQTIGTNIGLSSTANIFYANNASAPNYIFGKSRGTTVGAQAAVSNNDLLGSIIWNVSDGTVFGRGAEIIAKADAASSAGSTPGRLEFYTTPSASVTPSERMRIDSSGNVMIANTSPVSGYILSITGSANITGQITSATNATTAPPTKTTNYSLTATDSSLIFNGSGSITLTLQAASSYSGRWIYLKNIAAFTVVSATSNVVPQAGGSAGTSILAATAGKWCALQSDGTNWQIMMSN